jgi:hypothetical protein
MKILIFTGTAAYFGLQVHQAMSIDLVGTLSKHLEKMLDAPTIAAKVTFVFAN